MAGQFDLVRREHTDQLANAIPNAQEAIIQRATHFLPYQKLHMLTS